MGGYLTNDEIDRIIEIAQEKDCKGNPVSLAYIIRKSGHAEATVKKYCEERGIGVGNGRGGLVSKSINLTKHDDEPDMAQVRATFAVEPKKPEPDPFLLLDDVKTAVFQHSQNVYTFSKRSDIIRVETHSGKNLEVHVLDIPDLIKELEQVGRAKLQMSKEL